MSSTRGAWAALRAPAARAKMGAAIRSLNVAVKPQAKLFSDLESAVASDQSKVDSLFLSGALGAEEWARRTGELVREQNDLTASTQGVIRAAEELTRQEREQAETKRKLASLQGRSGGRSQALESISSAGASVRQQAEMTASVFGALKSDLKALDGLLVANKITTAEWQRETSALADEYERTQGIDFAVEVDRALPEIAFPAPSASEREIGQHIALQIPNGATLQMGIGKIPDATLEALRGHEHLGVHTEMFSDGLVELVERGVVTGREKTRWQNRVVTSFVMGTKRVTDFVDTNPFVEFHPSDLVNDAEEIAKQHRMIAINSAIEIDLTGQVCADSIGDRIYSGIGGQMDFMRGAVRSEGGKAFIALPSTAAGGAVSRIVPRLKPGAGVVTTRGHVQYVVTEHGVVNLRGRSLRQRAEMLISIAHPEHRRALRHAAAERQIL